MGVDRKLEQQGTGKWPGVNPVPILKRSHYEFSFYFDLDPPQKAEAVT